jgi:hypothetical protein
MTFSKGEEFKTALNLNIGCGLSLSYILYPFLLYTNLDKAQAKLNTTTTMYIRGDTEPPRLCSPIIIQYYF